MKQQISSFLIDDSRDARNQFFLAFDLLQVSKACICFDDVDHAAAFCTAQPDTPDYIFLRVQQPAEDGKRMLDQLRQIPSLENTPVIFYAAAFTPEDMTRMKSLGAADWLVKSSDLHQLKNCLHTMLEAFERRQTAVPPVPEGALSPVLV
ncbi:response regulator [Chitinophaga sp. Mgbs1]|uniref:Response regulator n=1 Tax=Chitinophaga solisilvae TaxID=1233460 RepID=A0A3S1D1L6_9BACT|nr:response regulator [Chitinophaga solisilvae]